MTIQKWVVKIKFLRCRCDNNRVFCDKKNNCLTGMQKIIPAKVMAVPGYLHHFNGFVIPFTHRYPTSFYSGISVAHQWRISDASVAHPTFCLPVAVVSSRIWDARHEMQDGGADPPRRVIIPRYGTQDVRSKTPPCYLLLFQVWDKKRPAIQPVLSAISNAGYNLLNLRTTTSSVS